jgi:hypothetical protein
MRTGQELARRTHAAGPPLHHLLRLAVVERYLVASHLHEVHTASGRGRNAVQRRLGLAPAPSCRPPPASRAVHPRSWQRPIHGEKTARVQQPGVLRLHRSGMGAHTGASLCPSFHERVCVLCPKPAYQPLSGASHFANEVDAPVVISQLGALRAFGAPEDLLHPQRRKALQCRRIAAPVSRHAYPPLAKHPSSPRTQPTRSQPSALAGVCEQQPY